MPEMTAAEAIKNLTAYMYYALDEMPKPVVLARDSVTYKNAVRFGMVVPSPHPVRFYFEKIGLKLEDDNHETD